VISIAPWFNQQILVNIEISNLEDPDIGVGVPDDEVFVTDSLPRYAKSYILPKVMKKDAVDIRLKKSEINTQDLESSNNKLEDKSIEAFKVSMLKASLDYESGFNGEASQGLIHKILLNIFIQETCGLIKGWVIVRMESWV